MTSGRTATNINTEEKSAAGGIRDLGYPKKCPGALITKQRQQLVYIDSGRGK